ncbi:MAG: 5-deoxy-glucuronate isomerase [Acidobacteria bacterium]|nr:5-deoxy-glucuronate isomerase [Acidobacteriota bacterium]
MWLHIPSPGTSPGVYPVVRRGEGLKHLSFTILELGGSLREYTFETGEEEVSLDSYTGPYAVSAEGSYGRWEATVPARPSIRDAHPMVYIPRDSRVTLRPLNGGARITIAGAEGKPGVRPVLVDGDQIVARTVGKDNWTRTVYTHIADNVDAAHLICGETVNRPGGWSSCPPHKHDRFGDGEVPMEEVYYFQTDPAQGFGFQRIYTDPADADGFDLAFPVQHGDTILIPRGYHPVAACPGYSLNYTWVLAGEGRVYGAWKDDPDHAWIKG